MGSVSKHPYISACPRGSHIRAVRKESKESFKFFRRARIVSPSGWGNPDKMTRRGSPSVWASIHSITCPFGYHFSDNWKSRFIESKWNMVVQPTMEHEMNIQSLDLRVSDDEIWVIKEWMSWSSWEIISTYNKCISPIYEILWNFIGADRIQSFYVEKHKVSWFPWIH